MKNWQWRHASKDEIDNMTYDKARGIIQPYIDSGIEAIKLGYLSGTDFPPRPSRYATRALQILVDRADKAEKYEKFLWEIINECKKTHYDHEDDLNSYYKIYNIIEDANEYLEKKGD